MKSHEPESSRARALNELRYFKTATRGCLSESKRVAGPVAEATGKKLRLWITISFGVWICLGLLGLYWCFQSPSDVRSKLNPATADQLTVYVIRPGSRALPSPAPSPTPSLSPNPSPSPEIRQYQWERSKVIDFSLTLTRSAYSSKHFSSRQVRCSGSF